MPGNLHGTKKWVMTIHKTHPHTWYKSTKRATFLGPRKKAVFPFHCETHW